MESKRTGKTTKVRSKTVQAHFFANSTISFGVFMGGRKRRLSGVEDLALRREIFC